MIHDSRYHTTVQLPFPWLLVWWSQFAPITMQYDWLRSFSSPGGMFLTCFADLALKYRWFILPKFDILFPRKVCTIFIPRHREFSPLVLCCYGCFFLQVGFFFFRQYHPICFWIELTQTTLGRDPEHTRNRNTVIFHWAMFHRVLESGGSFSFWLFLSELILRANHTTITIF